MILDPPGFFGKVPARGDFVGRRVPAALAEPWDAWLGLLTTSVREQAQADWPDVWLTAPVWHFVLGAGAVPGCDGAAGVLIASTDRVGRMFPFTVIGPADGIPSEDWCDTVETLALDSLEDGFDPDLLDQALLHLGPPARGEALAQGASLWRCRGSDRVDASSLVVRALPERAVAAGMVLGAGELPQAAPERTSLDDLF